MNEKEFEDFKKEVESFLHRSKAAYLGQKGLAEYFKEEYYSELLKFHWDSFIMGMIAGIFIGMVIMGQLNK